MMVNSVSRTSALSGMSSLTPSGPSIDPPAGPIVPVIDDPESLQATTQKKIAKKLATVNNLIEPPHFVPDGTPPVPQRAQEWLLPACWDSSIVAPGGPTRALPGHLSLPATYGCDKRQGTV